MLRSIGMLLILPVVASAKPEVIWSVPTDISKGRMRPSTRLTWINEDEVIAVRRGGLIGRYHCGEKKIVWEKREEKMIGSTVAPAAVHLIVNERPRTLQELDPKDGSVRKRLNQENLNALPDGEDLFPNDAIWLPKPGLLAIESLETGASALRFFDTRAVRFQGGIPLGDYLWKGAAHEDRISWLAKGAIFSARYGDREGEHVWDSGIGAGGDDAPYILAYAVGENGGFVAVKDNGGWTAGATFYVREDKEGKVAESTIHRELQAVTIDMARKRIWGTEPKTGWLGTFDFSGKVVSETEGLLPESSWEIAVSPSAKRVVVTGNEGSLVFVNFP